MAKKLIGAAKKGLLNDVHRLMVRPELKEWLPHALMAAAFARKKNVEMIALLAPCCDTSLTLMELISDNGATPEIVALLLPTSDPLYRLSAPLRYAAQNNNLDVVALLLRVSDPMARECEALQHAAIYGNDAMIRLLLPVSDAEVAWKGLENRYLRCRGPVQDHHREFIKAAEHVCDAVSPATLFKYEREFPKAFAKGPKVRARVTALKLNRSIPSAPVHAVQRARL